MYLEKNALFVLILPLFMIFFCSSDFYKFLMLRRPFLNSI